MRLKGNSCSTQLHGVLRALALLGAGVVVSGCTFVNKPLNESSVPLESRLQNHTRAGLLADATADADGYFVGVALSGGGSRSANFSAACLLQLERLGILQHVDYISSASGGSLTAACYCLDDDARWNPGALQKELTHSFASDLIVQTFLPWNLFALCFTDWDRSDILAGAFTQHLFSREGRALTFADLRPDRPHLLINATDLQSGHRFIFCNESFNDLNSNLSQYPIAYAVAASAAVPVLLHQVTVRDFSTIFHQYRHLIDAGIADNLGVQSLVETYQAQIDAAQSRGLPTPYPNGLILIVVDAHTQFDASLSSKGDVGILDSLKYGAGLTSTALLNRASSATLADIIVHNAAGTASADDLRADIAQLEKTGYLSLTDKTGHTAQVVHLSLERVNELSDLPFSSFRESVNNIDTYFNIDATEAYNLYEAANLLITQRFEPRLLQMKAALEAHRAPVAANNGQSAQKSATP